MNPASFSHPIGIMIVDKLRYITVDPISYFVPLYPNSTASFPALVQPDGIAVVSITDTHNRYPKINRQRWITKRDKSFIPNRLRKLIHWLICTLLSTLIPYVGFAQRISADSLLQRIGATEDASAKIDLAYDLYFSTLETDPELGKQNGETLLRQAQHQNDKVGEAMALFLIGANMRQLGQSISGLKKNFEALAIAEKIENHKLIAAIQNSIGNSFKDQGQYRTAIKRYLTSLKEAAGPESDEIRSFALMNLGEMYFQEKLIDSAYVCLLQAENLCRRIKFFYFISAIEVDLADVYAEKADWYAKQPASPYNIQRRKELADSALFYLEIGLNHALGTQKRRHLNWAYTGLAIYYKNRKISTSRFYAREAIKVVENTKFITMSLTSAKILADSYENENCDSSLKYSKIYRAASDSLLNLTVVKRSQVMDFNAEAFSQELKTSRRDNIQYALIALAVVTAFVLFLTLIPRIFIAEKHIKVLGKVCFLLLFESLNLYFHPGIEAVIHYFHLMHFRPLLMLLALVILAATLVPIHHQIERKVLEQLLKKNRSVKLAILHSRRAKAQEIEAQSQAMIDRLNKGEDIK